MKRYGKLYGVLCSYNHLERAFKSARKHKTTKSYVIKFEKNLKDNLLLLRSEILLHSYQPEPLKTFILRDPKTRKISKSAFRDRVIHHALVGILEPIFDKTFIYDSYANRIGKGTLNAVRRFDFFKRKASRNFTRSCYVLKADIRKYFESVDHSTLLSILQKKVKDPRILWLVRTILSNYSVGGGDSIRGMPLGNLTSQFFANVYLNELDQFVKNELKAEFYIRYVDDFVILHGGRAVLEGYKGAIRDFLKTIKLELHPDKSKIIPHDRGVNFLGYRIFPRYKLLRKSNLKKFNRDLLGHFQLAEQSNEEYDSLLESLHGWLEYARWANTHSQRMRILIHIRDRLCHRIALRDIDRWLKCGKSEQCTGHPPTLNI